MLLAAVAFLATLAGPVQAGPATNLAFTTPPSETATTGAVSYTHLTLPTNREV